MSNCPICNDSKSVKIHELAVQCQCCQAYYQPRYPSQDELKKYYTEKYGYLKNKSGKGIFNEDTYQRFLERSLRKRFPDIIDTFPRPLNILEIGADAGGASIYMKGLGHDVSAVEMCKEYAYRMEKKGITVYQDMFENIAFPKKYDVIVALEVLEHFSNPVRVINKIYDLLVPGGWFIFETPLAETGLVKSSTYGMQYAHYCIFNDVSIRVLFNKFTELPSKFEHGNGIYKVRRPE